MQLSNTFTVSLPVDQTWATFLDLERIAPCLPGAAITDVEGDSFHGGVKIKVGPISAQYRGTATFVEKDESAHRAVISAKGKDVGGQGNAEATIIATLTPHGDGTQVRVDTDLDLSGRVAQFGRGVIGDVTGRLLTQFAKNLEAEINAGSLGGSTAAGGNESAGSSASSTRPRQSLDDVEPLDVVGSMGGLIAKYAVPAAGALVLAGVSAILLGRKNRTFGSQGGHNTGFNGGFPAGFGGGTVNIFLTLPAAFPSTATSHVLPALAALSGGSGITAGSDSRDAS
ncbi:MAG: SRPBCC family protein [Jiangellaceae bacterium]